jgi:hypothetical protein
LSKDKTP